MKIPKTIWKKEEISIADELLELVPKLRDEFLEYHKDFHTTFLGGNSYAVKNKNAILEPKEKIVWKVEGLRYSLPQKNIENNMFLQPEIRNAFPTAASLTQKYIAHVGCSGYSILDPGGVITRHVDIENFLRTTIRIHIPLIIPEGDTFLEVRGVEMDWSDLFGFDNGDYHSAYNNTEKRRLVYIIDISRSFLGIPEIGRG
jgi:hypothetical protein